MKNLAIIFLLTGMLSNISLSQEEFNASKFSNTKKMQRKLVEVQTESVQRHDVSKVLISECLGAFNLSDGFLNKDFGNQSYLKKYILPEMKKYVPEVNVGGDYLSLLSDFVYFRIVRVLTDNGWTVVDKEDITNNELYQNNNFGQQETRKYNETIEENPEQTFYRSAYGMGKLPDINFSLKEPEVLGVIASIADEKECQANLRIHYSIQINNSGQLTLNDFVVKMDTWLNGYKKGTNMVYKWKSANENFFKLEEAVTGTLDYHTASSQEMNEELTKMISYIAEMFSYQLAEGI